VLERAQKNRWKAQFSWVISKTQGTVSNSTYAGISSSQFETPNGSINDGGPTGYDRRHMVRLFAGYQIPKIEVSINGYFRYESGWPYAPYALVSKKATGWTGSIYNNLVPHGTEPFFVPGFTQTDLRLEKVINYGVNRFGFYLDLMNAFNQNSIQGEVGRYPSTSLTNPVTGASATVYLGQPTSQQAARQITLGIRWSF
jgi:hypothetical protein